ncbi:MAG: DUF192 domain-containing protein [Proteobacteria bacterium]|nr:DUF192 domain-containing protein [Pseudomonadota bacterium]
MAIRIYFYLFVLLNLLLSCSNSPAEVSIIFPNNKIINAEVVSTEREREFGLMYRKSMPEDHGMLFNFPDENERMFWMKNTYLELDMIFLDKDLAITCIIEKATPLTETPRKCEKPSKFVLELLGGTASKLNLTLGIKAQIRGRLLEAE